MNFFVWSTIVLGVWSALGPLVGILIGHRITKEWQKKQWILENKKQEYREVIQALSTAQAPIIQCVAPGLIVGEEERRARYIAENKSYEVLGNRLFVAKELDELDIYDQWVHLISKFEKTRDDREFARGVKAITEDIRHTALKSLEAE